MVDFALAASSSSFSSQFVHFFWGYLVFVTTLTHVPGEGHPANGTRGCVFWCLHEKTSLVCSKHIVETRQSGAGAACLAKLVPLTAARDDAFYRSCTSVVTAKRRCFLLEDMPRVVLDISKSETQPKIVEDCGYLT